MANIRGIELASEVYDLEDTSARDTATTASQTATQAGQTATTASETATQASQTATQASQTATTASETAAQASQTATTASETATAAQATATQAQTTATQASQTATQASQTATQASQTATQASQTATTASETARDAKAQADAARDDIGDISALETSDTTDLVSAINEVNSKVSNAELITDDEISGITCSVFATGNTAQVFIKGETEGRVEGHIVFENILPEHIRPKEKMFDIIMNTDEDELVGYIRVNTNGNVYLINKNQEAWEPGMLITGQVTFIF